MADSSFDIVSKIDQMELDNAFNQCDREIATRFDFKTPKQKLKKLRLRYYWNPVLKKESKLH